MENNLNEGGWGNFTPPPYLPPPPAPLPPPETVKAVALAFCSI